MPGRPQAAGAGAPQDAATHHLADLLFNYKKGDQRKEGDALAPRGQMGVGGSAAVNLVPTLPA